MRPTVSHRLRTCAFTIAAITALAVPAAVPAAVTAAELMPDAVETPSPVAVPAGSCSNPSGNTTDAAVKYRWVSRSNGWRVRPAFTSIATTSAAGGGTSNGAMTQNTMHTGAQAWYLVLDARQVGAKCWLRVRMPASTNSRGGWVDRDSVIAQRLVWQIEVDLSDRRVRMFKGARKVLDKSVVIGKESTPTPTTRAGEPFAMYDAKRGAASDFTGTWQLATTARSEVDPDLGRIGIHGRGGASLSEALGMAASHGCVRADNSTVDAIVRMAGLPGLLGVPVVITA